MWVRRCWNCKIRARWGIMCWDCSRAFFLGAASALGTAIIAYLIGG